MIRKSYSYNYDPDEDKTRQLSAKQKKPTAAGCGVSVLWRRCEPMTQFAARVLVGRLAKPREPGSDRGRGWSTTGRTFGGRELYVAGIGWVPVDPLLCKSCRGQPGHRFPSATTSGDLLVLHVDIDLQLPFPDKTRETVGASVHSELLGQRERDVPTEPWPVGLGTQSDSD